MPIDKEPRAGLSECDVHGELGRQLADAVAGIEAPADIVERARAGGRRRLRRHRTLTAAAVVLVTGLAGLLVAGAHPLADRSFDPADRRVDDPYGWMLAGPTRGDLAGDKELQRDAVTAWNDSHKTSPLRHRGIFDDLHGEPKVAWAGRTSAGRRGAVVVHPRKRGLSTVVGVVGQRPDGQLYVIAADYSGSGPNVWHGFMFDRTLVVLDDGYGHRTSYATRREYGANGSVIRQWRPLTFRDGTAIVTLAPGTNLAAVRLAHLHEDRSVDFLGIAGQPLPSERRQMFASALSWYSTVADSARFRGLSEELERRLAAADPTARLHAAPWRAYGMTSFNAQVAVGEFAYDDDPSRVYAIVKYSDGTVSILSGGVPTSPQIAFRLPGTQEWVTASYGIEVTS